MVRISFECRIHFCDDLMITGEETHISSEVIDPFPYSLLQLAIS